MNGIEIYVSNDINNKDIVLNGEALDLDVGEKILMNLKQTDFQDIGSNFNDYSQDIVVPASPRNNRIFKYWYDINNDNQFPSVQGIPARIDIEGVMFRMGTIQILNVKTDDFGRPSNYTIKFVSSLKSLKDDFGDTLIGALDYTSTLDDFNYFEYNDENVRSIIQNNVNAPLEMPIISTQRILDNYEIIKYTSDNTLGLKKEELRPAMCHKTIFSTIEQNYGIRFVGNFYVNNSPLDKLYLWCNKNEEPTTSGVTLIGITGSATFSATSGYVNYGEDKSVYFDTTKNLIKLSKVPLPAKSNYWFLLSVQMVTSNNYVPYKIFIQEVKLDLSGNVDEIATKQQDNEGYVYSSNYVQGSVFTDIVNWTTISPSIKNGTSRYFRILIEAKSSIVFTDTNIIVRQLQWYSGGYDTVTYRLNSPEDNSLIAKFYTPGHLPDIKVYDYIQSIVKMYNLLIIPVYNPEIHSLVGTNRVYQLETYNDYYGKKNEIDITKYTNPNHTISKFKTFKKFEFKHTDSQFGTNIMYKNAQLPKPREYGSFSEEFKIGDDGDFKVETKFGLMIWRELPNVGLTQSYDLNNTWIIADSLGEDFTKGVYNKPIIFNYNGKSSIIENKFLAYRNANNTTLPLSIYSIFSNKDSIVGDYKTTLAFSFEQMLGQGIQEKTLYTNYYKKLVSGIFSPYSRETDIKAILPKFIINKMDMGTKLIVGNNIYTIRDIQVDLITGEANLKVNNIVEEGDILEVIMDLPPYPPTSFSGVSVGTTSSSGILLNWSGIYDDYGIVSHILDYSTNGLSYSYLGTVTSSNISESFTHTGVSQGITYSYRLRIKDIADNYSDYSYTSVFNADSINPNPPSVITSVPNTLSIHLYWYYASDNIGISGYEVSYKPSSGTTYSTLPFITTTYTNSNINVSGLSIYTSYDFRIRTKDNFGNYSSYATHTKSTTAVHSLKRSSDYQTDFGNYCAVNFPTVDVYAAKPADMLYIGDYVYTNNTLTTPFNGGENWWRIGSYDDYIFPSFYIDTTGRISSIQECGYYTHTYNRSDTFITVGDGGLYEISNGCYLNWVTNKFIYFRKRFEDIVVGDKAYNDNNSTALFNGGGHIWKVHTTPGDYSVRISSNGTIQEIYQCFV